MPSAVVNWFRETGDADFATFVPRGSFAAFAAERLRELRASLMAPYGEQHFSRYLGRDYASKPRFDPVCWDKRGDWHYFALMFRTCCSVFLSPATVERWVRAYWYDDRK